MAVRQGVLMATAFHPELTADTRWHQLFAEMVRAHAGQAAEHRTKEALGRAPNRPADLPVYGVKNPLAS